MSRLTRSAVSVAAMIGALVVAAPASAAPPGQVVVFEEHVTNEPVSYVAPFPCLGEPGMQDDDAQITGRETRHITVTAAGVDPDGRPIAPYTIRAFLHNRVTIDPLAPGLPTYAGSSLSIFRERVSELRRHVIAIALFKAVAVDGDDRRTFRFFHHLLVGPDGTVRVDRTSAACTPAE
jgi:hypothetical protein